MQAEIIKKIGERVNDKWGLLKGRARRNIVV